jgi:hypothetical protein
MVEKIFKYKEKFFLIPTTRQQNTKKIGGRMLRMAVQEQTQDNGKKTTGIEDTTPIAHIVNLCRLLCISCKSMTKPTY